MKLGRLFSAFLPLTWLLALAVPVAAPGVAAAQSSCTYLATGTVLTAGQWNACWASKQDYSAGAIRGPSSATNGDVACWSNYLLLNDCGASTGTGVFVRSTSPTLVTPSLGAATASSLALTTPLAVANGGSGQTSAAAAFNTLSPVTTAGDVIVGTGANTAGRLAIGGAGTVLSSNGSVVSWQAAGAGTVTTTGSPTAGNIAAFSGATAIAPAAVTGSGSVVLATSPTITTPAIMGRTNGTTPGAGQVGEIICAYVASNSAPAGTPACGSTASTPVSMTVSGQGYNVAQITLTPGNWSVCAMGYQNPVSVTTFSFGDLGVSSVSATIPSSILGLYSAVVANASGAATMSPGCNPFSFSASTTLYLVEAAFFSGGSVQAFGYIHATRTQ